jgi:hypothetical protein
MELNDYLTLQNKRKHSHRSEESNIQIAVVNWLRHAHPKLIITTSPAGIKMNIGQRSKIKKMGYRSGTADLLIFRAIGQHHGLSLEIKTDVGIPTHEQLVWQREMIAEGYCALITRGYKETVNAISDYLSGLSPSVQYWKAAEALQIGDAVKLVDGKVFKVSGAL